MASCRSETTGEILTNQVSNDASCRSARYRLCDVSHPHPNNKNKVSKQIVFGFK